MSDAIQKLINAATDLCDADRAEAWRYPTVWEPVVDRLLQACQSLHSDKLLENGMKLSPEMEQEKLDNNRFGVTVPEWNGEGLPPVGVVCEFVIGKRTRFDAHGHWEDGDELEVLAHRNACAIVYNKTARAAAAVNTDCMRPIKTERQKQIDAIEAIIYRSECETTSAAERLYNAGFRIGGGE
jgi:hypothetical protein